MTTADGVGGQRLVPDSLRTPAESSSQARDRLGEDARDVSWASWWYLAAGIAWTAYGLFVLSYRPGTLAAVALLVGFAFIAGGVGQLVLATRVESYRWLMIVSGILGVVAGIVTFAWPDMTLYIASLFVAWYLVIFGLTHVISSLASPKVSWWSSQLFLGVAELILGVWALRSYQRSLLTFVTLVGVWAIMFGVAEIFGAFTVHDSAKRLERAVR